MAITIVKLSFVRFSFSSASPYRSSVKQVLIGKRQLGIDILQVPLKGLAVQPLSDGQTIADISIAPLPNIGSLGVIEILVLVHPGLRQAHVVPDEDPVDAPREGVRLLLTEYVSHPGARNELQLPSTHPYLETCNMM